MLIFPRVCFKQHILNVGADNPSGWSNENKFLQYKSINKHPVLLLFDNHDSRVSIPLINLVVLLTFPLHTSHKLQSLDLMVFGPYTTYYNQAVA